MNKTYKKRNRKAGAAVNSGGFGCLFSPSLKCKNMKTKKNHVSKLLIKKYGEKELTVIHTVKKILKTVPNYKKYYLLDDIEKCLPQKLDKDDLENFDEKCENLNKLNITSENVNKNLDKLISINIPYGGINLNEWLFSDKKINKEKLIKLNNIVVRLLKNAVLPMSNLGIIHGDIKDKNILIDENSNVRIIDWGISGISTKKNIIPTEIINRPLQFNTPFSSIIFGEDFLYNYEEFLKKTKKKQFDFNRSNISTFVRNEYLIKLARYYGYYDDNITIFNNIFSDVISQDTYLSEQKKESLLEYGYFLNFLAQYNTEILIKYTKNYKLNIKKYTKEVYIFNCNIWGLLTIYYNIFFIYNTDINIFTIDKDSIKVYINTIRDMLVENLFKNGDVKINVNKVLKKINTLNYLLKHSKKKQTIKNKITGKSKTKKNILSISKF